MATCPKKFYSKHIMEPANILIIGDDHSKTEMIKSILEELTQNVITCVSGQDGLRVLLKTEIAVILLDVNMPGLDGFETAALIRKNPQTSTIPILFTMEYDQSELNAAKGYPIGAVDCIFTKIDPLILKSKVKVLVDLFNYARQITIQDEQLRRQISENESLNLKLNEVNENLEALNSIVINDLRAPLRHITDFADLLKKAGKDRMEGKMLFYIEIISTTAIKMSNMIEESLRFRHAETGV